MKRTPLTTFVGERTQEECAALLGCTQGAISKALRVGRTVYVTEHEDGTFTAQELRPFPSHKDASAGIDQSAGEVMTYLATPARTPFTDRRQPLTFRDKPRAGKRGTDLTEENAAALERAEQLAEHLQQLAPGKAVGG